MYVKEDLLQKLNSYHDKSINFTCETIYYNGYLYLRFNNGYFDNENIETFSIVSYLLLDRSQYMIIYDLSGISYIADNCFVLHIIRLGMMLDRLGGNMIVGNMKDSCLEVLQILGWTELLHFSTDIKTDSYTNAKFCKVKQRSKVDPCISKNNLMNIYRKRFQSINYNPWNL